MRFEELPEWAQKDVREMVTRWYTENGEAAFGKAHLKECVRRYIDDHDTFHIAQIKFKENMT